MYWADNPVVSVCCDRKGSMGTESLLPKSLCQGLRLPELSTAGLGEGTGNEDGPGLTHRGGQLNHGRQ